MVTLNEMWSRGTQYIRGHWLSFVLLALIALGGTCYACHTPPDVTTVDSMGYTDTSSSDTWSSDTLSTEKLVTAHAHGTAKGIAVAPKRIVFQGSVVSPFADSAFMMYHDTLDLSDTTLSSDVTTAIPTVLPIIVRTVERPVIDRSHDWTFAEIGAAIGSLALIVVLFLLHIL